MADLYLIAGLVVSEILIFFIEAERIVESCPIFNVKGFFEIKSAEDFPGISRFFFEFEGFFSDS